LWASFPMAETVAYISTVLCVPWAYPAAGNPLASPKVLHQAPVQDSSVPTDSWQLHHRAQSLPSPISLPSPPKICPVPTTQSGTRTASKSPVSRQLQYPPPSINLWRPGTVPPSHLGLVQTLLGCCYRGQGRGQQPPAMAVSACTDTYGLACLLLLGTRTEGQGRSANCQDRRWACASSAST